MNSLPLRYPVVPIQIKIKKNTLQTTQPVVTTNDYLGLFDPYKKPLAEKATPVLALNCVGR